jgi:putative FmdB family regulatory protein
MAMPLFEYKCPSCQNIFEELRDFEDIVYCPGCRTKSDKIMSLFNWKWYNPFTKDGEGFSSVHYDPKEYDARIKANAGKYD